MENILMDTGYQSEFAKRHIGPNDSEIGTMLAELGYSSIDELIKAAVPDKIYDETSCGLNEGADEYQALERLAQIVDKNQVFKSYIGMGYYDAIMPPVLQRNILENPGWYTQYTPYQSEISQGRLEALFNFQTMIADLTGLAVANGSLLDEGTSCAEAMSMCRTLKNRKKSDLFYIDEACHPQTIAVVRARAEPLGIELAVVNPEKIDFNSNPFGILVQYPDTYGTIKDYQALIAEAHDNEALVVMAADPLSLTLITPPGELGADIAVGSTQRFGLGLGYGGPHAGYFAAKKEYLRQMPGRIVGLSKDRLNKKAFRLALATREQHIRRGRATSNICTSQVLTAIISSMYAMYHGPSGLKRIAKRINALTRVLANQLKERGFELASSSYFDTLRVTMDESKARKIVARAQAAKINLCQDAKGITLALDETTTLEDVADLLKIFSDDQAYTFDAEKAFANLPESLPSNLKRTSPILQHKVFNSYHSETQMLRYLKMLEGRDLSLTRSMIPLGSCTMKLNAASELLPLTWSKISRLHPFIPESQAQGYRQIFQELEEALAKITGFSAVSLQPNAGAQGEYAGLMVIRKYLKEIGQGERNICLIPTSAHGTNPASAAMAGLKIVEVLCDDRGNIDHNDLLAKAEKYREGLAALMITYPSTHGVFEEGIERVCEIVHECGGQVYMDGANLQAQIGLMKTAKLGADVCHINLHKTFAIPHGGGGPGVGPIAVKEHLAPYLPGHPIITTGGNKAIGPVSSAPWGNASAMPISWMYIKMMGERGLRDASKVAILNANYIAKKLDKCFPIVYKGKGGLVAHECIIDLKQIKKATGIDENDIAKRLVDFGFHAPTVSWPVPNSMMIEPTESESLAELDRFIAAMTQIRSEIARVETGELPKDNNPLKNAPHTIEVLIAADWDYPYSRMEAALPAANLAQNKFWPHVARTDNTYGDRNFIGTYED